MGYGILASLNQEVDFDTAFLVASEFGITAHKKEVVSDEDILFDESEESPGVSGLGILKGKINMVDIDKD